MYLKPEPELLKPKIIFKNGRYRVANYLESGLHDQGKFRLAFEFVDRLNKRIDN